VLDAQGCDLSRIPFYACLLDGYEMKYECITVTYSQLDNDSDALIDEDPIDLLDNDGDGLLRADA